MTSENWSRDPDDLAERMYPSIQRRPSGLTGWIVTIASCSLTLVTFYMGWFGQFGPIETRAGHLAVIIPLAFLLYPAFIKRQTKEPTFIDRALAVAAFIVFAWAVYFESDWQWRMAYVDSVGTTDFLFGIIAILLVLEATRRTVGITIVILTALFVAYALSGPYWPGLFEHSGTSIERLVEQSYLLSEGLFNVITGIAATFLFTFLAFGVFLQAAGGDRFFMNLAMAISGRRKGGPAKVSVLASSMMGMLSGSTVSNVVTTGSITIPLMKRMGFRPHEAGGIEAASSLGGALTPPLMGAGVFLMAQFTGVPLITVMAYSIAPAIIYFASIYAYVHIRASKRGLEGIPAHDLPNLKEVIARSWHLSLPLILLVILLVFQYTPFFASTVATLSLIAISQFRKSSRLSIRQIIMGLEGTARVAIVISTLSAAAALIFGVITITGLVVKVSSIILAFSNGYLILAMILIALMSYVVGMGLPITASYIIVATLGASALGDLGVSILAAHLIIYWLSQDATITPPICMTAFVSAGIARADPMRTGFQAVLLGKALYIVPLGFAFANLLSPDVFEVLTSAGLLLIVVCLIPIVVEGYWLRAVGIFGRSVMSVIVAISFWGATQPIDIALASGVMALLAISAIYWHQRRKVAHDTKAA